MTDLRLTDEDCEDIMGTASYGGITYWAEGASERQRAKYKHADFVFWDREGERVVSLTKGQIRSAYFKLLANEPRLVGTMIHGYMLDSMRYADEETRRPDLGFIDADAADCIVQVAAFGEVLYG